MKPKNHVWVVEMIVNGKFLPCADAKTFRSDARRELKVYWKENYPLNSFRIVKYISPK